MIEEKADNLQTMFRLIDQFSDRMKMRLVEKELDGYKGWNNKGHIPGFIYDIERKLELLDRESDNGVFKRRDYDPQLAVDIANFASLIWWNLE